MELTFLLHLFVTLFGLTSANVIPLPMFKDLKANYPGYKLFGGRFSHRHLLNILAVNRTILKRDTSALRLSLTLNQIGGTHGIGQVPIELSVNGTDSVKGFEGLEYIFHPLAYGPYLVDKYGYPNVSLVHQTDPVTTKDKFWGKQGIVQVTTFTRKGNRPKGHIGLWDCDHFHEAKDWIGTRSLVTVEMWASPDSNCSHMLESRPSPHGFRILPPHPLKAKHQSAQEVTKDSTSGKRSPLKRYPKFYNYKRNIVTKNQKYSTKVTGTIPNKPYVYRVKGIKFDPVSNRQRWDKIIRRKKAKYAKRHKHINETTKERKRYYKIKKSGIVPKNYNSINYT